MGASSSRAAAATPQPRHAASASVLAATPSAHHDAKLRTREPGERRAQRPRQARNHSLASPPPYTAWFAVTSPPGGTLDRCYRLHTAAVAHPATPEHAFCPAPELLLPSSPEHDDDRSSLLGTSSPRGSQRPRRVWERRRSPQQATEKPHLRSLATVTARLCHGAPSTPRLHPPPCRCLVPDAPASPRSTALP